MALGRSRITSTWMGRPKAFRPRGAYLLEYIFLIMIEQSRSLDRQGVQWVGLQRGTLNAHMGSRMGPDGLIARSATWCRDLAVLSPRPTAQD